MTQRHSNSYGQMQQVLDGFPPEEPITTHMVISGQTLAERNPAVTPAVVQRELADLLHAAEAFNVLISFIYDEVGNAAIIALNGKATNIGDLAAFMSGAKSVNAG